MYAWLAGCPLSTVLLTKQYNGNDFLGKTLAAPGVEGRVMNVSEHCCRGVVSITDTADVVTAARLMRDEHVGLLAVFHQGDVIRRLTGVLTDRDIVMQVTASDRDPHEVRVQEIMTRQPILAYENDELRDVLQVMRLAGIHQVPMVDANGTAVGVIALDDAIELIAGLLSDISGSSRNERHHEWRAHA